MNDDGLYELLMDTKIKYSDDLEHCGGPKGCKGTKEDVKYETKKCKICMDDYDNAMRQLDGGMF